MLKGIQMQFQGIKTYLDTNQNSQTVSGTWECYFLSLQKIVLEIFHLNLMVFDHLENSLPKSLKSLYAQILGNLKVFFKNKPKNQQKDDSQAQYLRKDYDQVDHFLNNRPKIVNNSEQRGQLYKFLMQNELKEKNNELFLKQIPMFNTKHGSKGGNKLHERKSLELFDMYQQNNVFQMIQNEKDSKQTQTQTTEDSMRQLLRYYVSSLKDQNKYTTFLNDTLQLLQQNKLDPKQIFNSIALFTPDNNQKEALDKKQENKSQQDPHANADKPQLKNFKSEGKRKENGNRQGKLSSHKKKDSKRQSIDSEHMKKNKTYDKGKQVAGDKQNILEKQFEQVLKKYNPLVRQSQIQKQFQEVLIKYCGSNTNPGSKAAESRSHIVQEKTIYELAQQQQNSDYYSLNMPLTAEQSQKLDIKKHKNAYKISQVSSIMEDNRESLAEDLQLESNIKSNKQQTQDPTYEGSSINQGHNKCTYDKACNEEDILSKNDKSTSFGKHSSQIAPSQKYSKLRGKEDEGSKDSYEIVKLKTQLKEREKIVSSKEEKYDKIQSIYFSTMNKTKFKSSFEGNKSQEKTLPKIAQKNKKGSPSQMSQLCKNSPYTQPINNYNKHILSKNTSLPTFNYKSLHYNEKANTILEKIVNVSQTLKPIEQKRRKEKITDEKQLLQQENSLMKEIIEIGQIKSAKSGQWMKIMNKIKNYELIHKGYCGQDCVHLIKFDQFLKKNKNKLYSYRKQFHLHKKDIFFG